MRTLCFADGAMQQLAARPAGRRDADGRRHAAGALPVGARHARLRRRPLPRRPAPRQVRLPEVSTRWIADTFSGQGKPTVGKGGSKFFSR